jgi:hypothetical protein
VTVIDAVAIATPLSDVTVPVKISGWGVWARGTVQTGSGAGAATTTARTAAKRSHEIFG